MDSSNVSKLANKVLAAGQAPASPTATVEEHEQALKDGTPLVPQDPSMFEEAGKKILPHIAPFAHQLAPILQSKLASGVLSTLAKPQEYATQAIDKATGGSGNATSFADVGARLNKKLPASMQNEGLFKDIGYAADIAFPIPVPKAGKLEALMANKAPKAAKILKPVERFGKTNAWEMADNVNIFKRTEAPTAEALKSGAAKILDERVSFAPTVNPKDQMALRRALEKPEVVQKILDAARAKK